MNVKWMSYKELQELYPSDSQDRLEKRWHLYGYLNDILSIIQQYKIDEDRWLEDRACGEELGFSVEKYLESIELVVVLAKSSLEEL